MMIEFVGILVTIILFFSLVGLLISAGLRFVPVALIGCFVIFQSIKQCGPDYYVYRDFLTTNDDSILGVFKNHAVISIFRYITEIVDFNFAFLSHKLILLIFFSVGVSILPLRKERFLLACLSLQFLSFTRSDIAFFFVSLFAVIWKNPTVKVTKLRKFVLVLALIISLFSHFSILLLLILATSIFILSKYIYRMKPNSIWLGSLVLSLTLLIITSSNILIYLSSLNFTGVYVRLYDYLHQGSAAEIIGIYGNPTVAASTIILLLIFFYPSFRKQKASLSLGMIIGLQYLLIHLSMIPFNYHLVARLNPVIFIASALIFANTDTKLRNNLASNFILAIFFLRVIWINTKSYNTECYLQ